MKNDNMTFGGFESVISSLTSNSTVVKASSDASAGDEYDLVDPKEINPDLEDEDVDPEDAGVDTDLDEVEDTKVKPKAKETTSTKDTKSTDSDFGEVEPEIASYLQE